MPSAPDRWCLEDMSGTRYPLLGAVVIGRAPQSVAAARGCQYLALGGDDSLSKAHALIEPDGDALLVTDLGSTNGSAAAQLAGPRRPLPRGERVRVEAGTVLELGTFLLTVLRF
ncbi:FHA domain-containing protein [Galbitalea sp. SE-J8]|uniref:FHA domain-containing protein n=1 Tax=Galbitalea sp. SE-J8 TaxID=3054952 RepID=UPI00259CE2CD|nr:FHA domain-containing protein [Galbitalea sp. SE-J8]MDM4763708.1 FHA domain-containing protein [Galbitalea sp. SE-J8]